MNYLAHFLLAYPDAELMTGGFLGDHVKGRLSGKLPGGLEQGVRLHRAIDVFTDQHLIAKKSQRRFDAEFRRYSAIMCDITFDHLLAKNWQHYCGVPLDEFCRDAYQTVVASREFLPEKALVSIQNMQHYRALESYGNEEFVDDALKSISKRLSRKNPLTEGFKQFQKNKVGLQSDFVQFMPVVVQFASRWIKTSSGVNQGVLELDCITSVER